MTTRRLGILLSVWSAGFACVHVAWALGWRGGTPASAAPIAERPVFLVYDVVAGLLMYAAAAVCLVLAAGGTPRRTTRVLTSATLVGAGLALARGVPALAWDVASGEAGPHLGFVADLWFTVAGGLGLWLWRTTRGAGRPQTLSLSAKNASTRSTPSC